MKQKHPFFDAQLNEELTIYGEPVYTDSIGRFAYTHPTYDSQCGCFKCKEYDMLKVTEEELIENLNELVEYSIFRNETELIEEFCSCYGINRYELNNLICEIIRCLIYNFDREELNAIAVVLNRCCERLLNEECEE